MRRVRGISPPMLTAYLLAGGLSSRMGRDKAFLHLDGKTLLEQALERLRPFGVPRILSGNSANTERREKLAAYGAVVSDRIPDAGPLGGIDAALHDASTDWVLILPVDQPNLPSKALQLWTAEVQQTCARASWFRQPAGPEPLPLLLHRSLAAAIAQALAGGARRLLPTVQAAVGDGGLPVFRDRPEWFTNLNHPFDLAVENRFGETASGRPST